MREAKTTFTMDSRRYWVAFDSPKFHKVGSCLRGHLHVYTRSKVQSLGLTPCKRCSPLG